MKLSIVLKENGQKVLQNDDETDKLDIGVQKKYYWKDHEAEHIGCEEVLKEKMQGFKGLKVGPMGVAIEFSDRNKGGNSRAQISMNTRRGNQIGNESSSNQNAIQSQNDPAVAIEEVPNEDVPEVEMAE